MFGLKTRYIDIIKDTLREYPEVEKATIFGSRAMGNFKNGSDIDIAITGEKITTHITSKISFILNEESPMPYFFDIVHYDTIANENLAEHIDQLGVVFYNKFE